MERENEKRFAILIDADNISTKYVKSILEEISNHGVATYKRVYGDLTRKDNKNWERVLLDNSLTPVQQYNYTTGKSSTDSAMIIDAMDILYSGNVEGFCIVSSDSDFTRLAARLRESGMKVIGMGEQKTAKPFVKACSLFKYLDLIAKHETEDSKDKTGKETGKEVKIETVSKEEILKDILKIIQETENGCGYNIGQLGQRLNKDYPDFDVRNYGYNRLSVFLKSFDCLETKETNVFLLQKGQTNIPKRKTIESFIVKTLEQEKTNEMNINSLKRLLEERYEGFDIGNYGYSKLSTFLKDFDSIDTRLSGVSNSIMTIRLADR